VGFAILMSSTSFGLCRQGVDLCYPPKWKCSFGFFCALMTLELQSMAQPVWHRHNTWLLDSAKFKISLFCQDPQPLALMATNGGSGRLLMSARLSFFFYWEEAFFGPAIYTLISQPNRSLCRAVFRLRLRLSCIIAQNQGSIPHIRGRRRAAIHSPLYSFKHFPLLRLPELVIPLLLMIAIEPVSQHV
jgi:hypothetical protein